jgi:lipid A 1-phosphatase
MPYLSNKEGIKQIFMVSAATFVTTQVLKTGLNNVRIGDKKLGDRPDGGGNNFPSGHTSSAFSAAWYIKKRYGLKNAAIPLIGAAFTAYSRVHSKKHDVAAVVGGALLGIAVAEVFTGKFEGGIPVLSLNTGSEESLYVGFMIDF